MFIIASKNTMNTLDFQTLKFLMYKARIIYAKWSDTNNIHISFAIDINEQ